MTRWITAIVQNRPDMACKVMIAPAAHGGPQAGDAHKCGDTKVSAQQIKKELRGFHASFTPRNPHNPPKVEVHGAAPSGHTAEFPGEQITIDGQDLNTVVYSNSKGVSKDGIDIKVKAMELQNRWYVNDLDMKIG
ncbi:hypothetical protein [Streptomyces sp. NPDC054786]